LVWFGLIFLGPRVRNRPVFTPTSLSLYSSLLSAETIWFHTDLYASAKWIFEPRT
jgi:hypothetical protein